MNKIVCGEKHGRLKVLKFIDSKNYQNYFLCVCDCGKEKKIREDHIGENTNSCGCLKSELLKLPKPSLQNEKSPNWKNNPGYRAIHLWVIKNKGKAKRCNQCGGELGKIEWSNIDHEYRRNLNDYVSLCTSCHRNYDIQFNGYKG